MTEFTKNKISFALALLATLFALHPWLDKIQDQGFSYPVFDREYDLKVSYAYMLIAGLLALCVYCYAVSLISERPSSWMERVGNWSYAIAVMIVPLYGGLFLVSLLAEQMEQTDLKWAAPTVALSLGVSWLVVSQLLAWRLRRRLGREDQAARTEQLYNHEINALRHAREMYAHDHYDLSVVEAWKAIEARLRRALLSKQIVIRSTKPQALIDAAQRARLLVPENLKRLDIVRRHWTTAISTDPLSKEAAAEALSTARSILASISLPDKAGQGQPTKNGGAVE